MKYLYDLWDDCISLLFPRLCYACSSHLLRNERLVCTECLLLIPRTNFHNDRDNPVEQLFWGRCELERAASFSYYNRGTRIRKLIHNLKYKGIGEIGTEMGRMYGHVLKTSGFLSDIDLIVPVPLHRSKERQRGFNQSDLIADGLAASSGLPVGKKVLVRSSRTQTQTRRSRYERWANVEGIFMLVAPELVAGQHILLVDDVVTTGSTIEACVNELRKAGDVKVSMAALAATVL